MRKKIPVVKRTFVLFAFPLFFSLLLLVAFRFHTEILQLSQPSTHRDHDVCLDLVPRNDKYLIYSSASPRYSTQTSQLFIHCSPTLAEQPNKVILSREISSSIRNRSDRNQKNKTKSIANDYGMPLFIHSKYVKNLCFHLLKFSDFLRNYFFSNFLGFCFNFFVFSTAISRYKSLGKIHQSII